MHGWTSEPTAWNTKSFRTVDETVCKLFVFGAYGLEHKELAHRFIHGAKVVMNDGTTFGGESYRGCFRLNMGCPRATLMEALERIAAQL